jgi:hypothetical protein
MESRRTAMAQTPDRPDNASKAEDNEADIANGVLPGESGAAPPDMIMTWKARVFQALHELATTRILLRTILLSGLSLGLIAVAFLKDAPASDSIWVYLMAQLGTGLLVGAVGSALVQLFILPVPGQLREELESYGREERSEVLRQLHDEIRGLQANVTAVQQDLRSHAARTDQPSIRALENAEITRVYENREEAASDIRRLLLDPSSTSIDILGISLNDFVRRGGSFYQGWSAIERAIKERRPPIGRTQPLSIRMLVLDPYSADARLFSCGFSMLETRERADRLKDYILYTAKGIGRLKELLEEDESNDSKITIELRFYRVPPQFSICSSNKVSFAQPYYLSRNQVQYILPIWRGDSTTKLHHALKEHFEALWNLASISATEVSSQHSLGVDRGLHEGGIVNIYSDPTTAQARMLWLLRNAKYRVWVSGISLAPMFGPRLYEQMESLVGRGTVDVRLLILDPESEQAYLKTYREHLAGLGNSSFGSHVPWAEYRRGNRIHTSTRVYQEIQQAIGEARRLMQLPDSVLNARLHSSAPVAYILIVDDCALVEQYHYGKVRPTHAPLQLTEETPLIEYRAPNSFLFPTPSRNSVKILEDHFQFVFEHLTRPLEP